MGKGRGWGTVRGVCTMQPSSTSQNRRQEKDGNIKQHGKGGNNVAKGQNRIWNYGGSPERVPNNSMLLRPQQGGHRKKRGRIGGKKDERRGPKQVENRH